MIEPRWEWALRDASGTPLAHPPSPVFTSRFDAEQWLGGTWRTLVEAGAAAAELRHEGIVVDLVRLSTQVEGRFQDG